MIKSAPSVSYPANCSFIKSNKLGRHTKQESAREKRGERGIDAAGAQVRLFNGQNSATSKALGPAQMTSKAGGWRVADFPERPFV
jgi:hypothetical protein